MAAALLFLVTAALFRNFLSFPGDAIVSLDGEDLAGQFVWWRQFGFDELRQGHLALWNPHLYCGEPFLGGFQSALLYPFNWLFLVLPLPFALNLSVALHVFLAGWFTFLWLSWRGSQPMSSLMGGFMFMMGASFFLHVVPGHLPNLSSMVWIPLIFLAVEGFQKERTVQWISLGMLAAAMQVFSGHVQYAYYTGMAVFFYVLGTWTSTKGRASFLGGLVLMGLGGGLLSAVQLFTGWEAAWESVRGQTLSAGNLDTANMNPERLWGLLMPNFFNGWKDYWGGGIYWEGGMFVSVTAFVLALYGLLKSSDPRKKVFAGLALLFALLAVGGRTPLFSLFCHSFPLFNKFRGVAKLNIFITLCLAPLAAAGMDDLLRNPKGFKSLAKFLWPGSLLFFLAALFFWSAPQLGAGKLYGKFGGHAAGMIASLLICGSLLGGLSFLSVFSVSRPLVRWGFPLLCFLELFTYANGNLPQFSFRQLNDRVRDIQETYDRDPGDYRVLTPRKNYVLGTTGSDIWGEDPMIPLRYALFAAQSQGLDYRQDILNPDFFHNFPPILGMLRLRYAFSEEGGRLTAHPTHLPELPRAYLIDHWEVVKMGEVFPRLAAPGFDPAKEVLLESSPGLETSPEKLEGAVTVKDISTDQVEILAEVSKPAVLVVTDNYLKGWKARAFFPSDPSDYAVMPGNGFQRAIPLKAGKHHFMLEYRPTVFTLGGWVSAAAWVLFLVLGVIPPGGGFRKGASSPAG